MIQLHPEALMFKVSSGEVIPCSAEAVTIEFMGDACNSLDPEIVHNAAHAVLHYFKDELGKCQVSVGEFAEALARVLRSFGLTVVQGDDVESVPKRVAEADLSELLAEGEGGIELMFFARLRQAFQQNLKQSPEVVRFKNLRRCVKNLAGARRWNSRCQQLSDQIVDYLRRCLSTSDNKLSEGCALVVS